MRRYQNEDGSLTAAGREHYGYGQARANMQSAKAKYKADQKAYSKAFNRATGAGQYIRGLTKKGREENERRYSELVKTANKASKSEAAYKQAKKEYKNSDEYKIRQEKIKKAAIAGAAVAATALAAYGAYKASEAIKNKAFHDAYKKGQDKAFSILEENSSVGWDYFRDNSYQLKNKNGKVIESGYLRKDDRPRDALANIQYRNNRAANEEYNKTMDRVWKESNDISRNVVEAGKYLYKNRKKFR